MGIQTVVDKFAVNHKIKVNGNSVVVSAGEANFKELYKIKEKMKNTNWLMSAVVVVLFIGFLTMLFMVVGIVLDAWRSKSTSYNSLIETIRSQEKNNGLSAEENIYKRDGK